MWRAVFLSLFAVVPSSTNYTLKTYDFGNGAGSGSSTNYNLQAAAGSSGGTLSSTNYNLPPGIRASTTVPTPSVPTFSNPDNSYDRLKITINAGSFPSDTTYAIAISTNNFVTTNYVQTDQTIGTSFSLSNYQTYNAWGGAGGVFILGLTNNTTYKVKVAALQGHATGSGFGPTASATTSVPSLTFGLSTSLTSSPPFAATFSNLPAGSVTAADATITATLTSNAEQGGAILIKDQNSGLISNTASFTLSSATADLSTANSGYGAQISSSTQSSGGPMISLSPFNGAGNTVGGLNNSWQQLASFATSVTAGSVTVSLHARSDTGAPAATDYADVVTLSPSLVF